MATKRQTEEAAQKWLEDNFDAILAHYGIDYSANVEEEETTTDYCPHEEAVSGILNLTLDADTYQRLATALKNDKDYDKFFINLAKKDEWGYPSCEMSAQDDNRIYFEISRFYTP